MPNGAFNLALLLPAWALVAGRVGGLVLATPLLSSAAVPVFVRVMLVTSISAMMLPTALPYLDTTLTLADLVTGMIGEIAIGVLIGLAASAVIHAAQLAGQVVSQEAGLALGEVFNPMLGNSATALQQVWFFVSMVAFIHLGGMGAMAELTLGSFSRIPPLAITHLSMSGETGMGMAEFSVDTLTFIFRLSLRMAGPAMIALMLTNVAMGFLVKTMPQFNVLTIGFSLKISLALVIVGLTIMHSRGVLADSVFESMDLARDLMNRLAAGVTHGAR